MLRAKEKDRALNCKKRETGGRGGRARNECPVQPEVGQGQKVGNRVKKRGKWDGTGKKRIAIGGKKKHGGGTRGKTKKKTKRKEETQN